MLEMLLASYFAAGACWSHYVEELQPIITQTHISPGFMSVTYTYLKCLLDHGIASKCCDWPK